MRTLIAIGLLVVLMLSSCRKETQGFPVLVLDDTDGIDTKLEIPIADMGWRAEAIPLETTDSCLIKNIGQLEESKMYYWIVSDNLIYKFDKAGRFIKRIGSMGQGPEEYVSAKMIQPVEETQELFVMDYFGRKMNVYDFDGHFLRTFKLPEETWMDKFRYMDGKIYYLTTGNSVMPDLYCYDVQTTQTDTLCRREREMGTEGYVGQTFAYNLDNDLYMFHYFNDTVYRIAENRIEPAWLFQTGKMKWTYDEVTIVADFTPKVRPDGPRIQVFDLFETKDYTFVFYTISKYQGEHMKSFLALYDKKQNLFYPHVNFVSDNPCLSIEKGRKLMKTSVPGALYAIRDGVDFYDKKGFEMIKEDDNPVLLRYVCE